MDNSGYLRKYTDTPTSNNGFYPPSSISPPSTPAPSHHGSFRQNSSMMYEPVSYGSKQASSESKSSASTAEPVNPQAKNSIASKSGGSRTSDFLKRCDNGTSSTRSSASGAPNRRARYGGSELRDLDDDDDSLERCFVNRRKYGHDHSSASNSSSNPRSSEGSSSMTAYEERKKTGRRGESNGTMTSPLGHVDPTSWLNGAQSSKFSDLLAASPPAHREVHRKILELAEYWMALPATKQRIDSVLQETIKQAEAEAIAGPAVVKQAWSDPITSNDKTVKDGRKSGDDSATTPTAEALKPASAGSITALPSPPATAAGTSDSAFPSIVGAKKTVNMEKQAGSVGSPAPAVAAVGSPRKSDAAAAPSPAPMSDATPTKTPALESPKSKSKSTIPSRATGLLSPTRSPKKTPLKESSAPPELPYKATSPSTAPNGAHGTPRLEAPTSLCTVTHPGPVASSSPVASVEPSPSNAPAPRNATYDEIPRFYFPLGRPTTKERVISGPLSKNNENPHLKIAEGTTLPIAMYDGGEKGATSLNHSQDEHSALGGRLAPMSTLRCADERTVHQFIHKEFAHVPSPVKLQKARMISSRQRGANGSSAVSKQESIYRQHLVQCMERICLHCFGVPRYLAHIIIKLIQDEMSEDHSASHRTKGSSTSSTGSSSTNNIITAQHVKDFYDVYLKNKDSLRRTFDVLILSSKLVTTTTQPAHHLADPTTLRPHLLPEDFHTYVEVLLQHHPGLIFLKEAPDFQSKYLDTVVHRIFYEVDKLDRGMISFTEFSMSRLMDAFRQLDASDDINAVLRFFSYEHFYVLYCLFWELDDDRDMMLSPQDFSRYITDDMMNPLIVQRVFSGVGRRLRCSTKNRICYEDFVWFCLSEEDKSTPPAIRYWFRILDLDGDGVLSIYELRMFFDATKAKVSQYVVDGGAAFEDVLCQVFDMMRCPTYTGISLAKLLGEPEGAHVALNMLTNVLKFYQFEQRDPFVAHQDRLMGGIEQTPWDRFARVQYDRMAQEVDE